LVVRYSYLWLDEHRRGREEGVKDRPCAIVLAVDGDADGPVVTVLPITHAAPRDLGTAIEIPPETKRRLGLDEERSWIVLTEANRFVWPGPDLRPSRRGDPSSVAFGPLPYALFETVRRRFLAALRQRRAGAVRRTE
jgi:mRNA-degrading endonuclease toxin of MazEF toxin-antitoxin module